MVSLVRSIISLASDFGLPTNFEDWDIVGAYSPHWRKWETAFVLNVPSLVAKSPFSKILKGISPLKFETWMQPCIVQNCYGCHNAEPLAIRPNAGTTAESNGENHWQARIAFAVGTLHCLSSAYVEGQLDWEDGISPFYSMLVAILPCYNQYQVP